MLLPDVSRMKRKIPLRRRVAFLAIIGFATLCCLELALRLTVPMLTLVSPDDFFKVFLLEKIDLTQTHDANAMHVSDPDLGWTLGQNVRRPEFSTNSLGLRGQREYEIPRPSGAHRGMVLGDSFSMGYGASDDDTYATQMEALLPNTEVPNLAVGGYGVDQAILRWEKIGRQLLPDFVVLGVFIQDFHRNVHTWRFEAPKPRFHVVDGALQLSTYELPPLEDLTDNAARMRVELAGLYRTPRVWLAGEYVFRRVLNKLRGHREPDETFDEKAQILRLLIARLAADCRASGIGLMVCSIRMQTLHYPDEQRIVDVVAAGCADQNVAYLPLARGLDATPQQLKQGPIYDPATGHWAPLGHRLAAEQIVAFLRQQGIVAW